MNLMIARVFVNISFMCLSVQEGQERLISVWNLLSTSTCTCINCVVDQVKLERKKADNFFYSSNCDWDICEL